MLRDNVASVKLGPRSLATPSGARKHTAKDLHWRDIEETYEQPKTCRPEADQIHPIQGQLGIARAGLDTRFPLTKTVSMHSALHDLRITKERISMELLNWPKTTGFSRETVLQPTIKDSLYHGIWASEEFVYSRITLIDSSPSFRHIVALYDKNLSFGLSTNHKKCLVVGRRKGVKIR